MPGAAVTVASAPPRVTVKIEPLPVFHDTTSEPAVTEVVASLVTLSGWLRVIDVPDLPRACWAIWLAAAFAGWSWEPMCRPLSSMVAGWPPIVIPCTVVWASPPLVVPSVVASATLDTESIFTTPPARLTSCTRLSDAAFAVEPARFVTAWV